MKLSIKLQNCYGIKKLEHEFDFSSQHSYAIYAPNGSMKTSFAKTFWQMSLEEEERSGPKDEIHGHPSVCEVKIDGQNIPPKEIFVIRSSIETTEESKHISTLLVDADKKQKYDQIYSAILKEKNSLIARLNKFSGIKKDDLEKQFLEDFHANNFLDVLESLDIDSFDEDFSHIKYLDIFDPEIVSIIKNPEVINYVDNYLLEYNKIFNDYPYFQKGIFNPSKAEKVAKVLDTEGFFVKENFIKLSGEDHLLGKDQLNEKIAETQKKIIENEQLEKIRKLMVEKAKSLKFQELLEKLKNPTELIIELKKLSEFRKKLWKSYLKKDEHFKSFIASYSENKDELTLIESEANLESTKWKDAISKFNDRFSNLPYRLDVKNKKSALLGKEAPHIVFIFTDSETNEEKVLERKTLNGLDVLSQGEKRALYLLNMIFEVEIRKKENLRTIFIIDDIADSFDYKNKYAIIQYLKDISSVEFFYQIILTHNFDFFRTISSRIITSRNITACCYLTKKNDQETCLFALPDDLMNPFDRWKTNLHNDDIKFIATIPFAREIIRYREGNASQHYKTLTALLHIKKVAEEEIKTHDILIENIFSIFVEGINVSSTPEPSFNGNALQFIYDTADIVEGIQEEESLNLERKIVLSIAIRLKAEEFMWEKLPDQPIISGMQTGKLFGKYKDKFGITKQTNVLEEVVLMTPENIHLNSFMYEPILDMSDEYLKNIYGKIKNINLITT